MARQPLPWLHANGLLDFLLPVCLRHRREAKLPEGRGERRHSRRLPCISTLPARPGNKALGFWLQATNSHQQKQHVPRQAPSAHCPQCFEACFLPGDQDRWCLSEHQATGGLRFPTWTAEGWEQHASHLQPTKDTDFPQSRGVSEPVVTFPVVD